MTKRATPFVHPLSLSLLSLHTHTHTHTTHIHDWLAHTFVKASSVCNPRLAEGDIVYDNACAQCRSLGRTIVPFGLLPLSSTRYLRLSTFTRDMILGQTPLRSNDNLLPVDLEKLNQNDTNFPRLPPLSLSLSPIFERVRVFSHFELFSGYIGDPMLSGTQEKIGGRGKKELQRAVGSLCSVYIAARWGVEAAETRRGNET